MPFTPAELEERRGYLGASEAAASIGLSPWYTQLELYKSKLGEAEPIEETLPMMVGTALEPVTLRMFEKETGLKVTDRQQQLVDPRYPWRRCTIDGRASDGWLVEAKASGVWQNWGKDEDAIPASIIYQDMHQLACDLDAPGVYVPVILGQRQFRLYKIERNAEMIDDLTKGELQFMEYVRSRTAPPPINSDDLKLLYPVDTGQRVVATAYIEKVARDLAVTKQSLKALKSTEESQAFEVQEFMKDASTLVDAKGNPLFTWNAHTENRIDVTALRKDHPGLAAAYSPPSVVRRLLSKIKL